VSGPTGVSEYVLRSVAPFQEDYTELTKTFGFLYDWDGVTTYMRLMAFAHTYHYLNWFSKASVIEWHQISSRRLRDIVSI